MKQTVYAQAKKQLVNFIKSVGFYSDTLDKLNDLVDSAVETALREESRNVVSRMVDVDVKSERQIAYQRLSDLMNGSL